MWYWTRWITIDLWVHHASIGGSSISSGALDDDAFIQRGYAVRPSMHVLAYNAYDPQLFAGIITATTGRGLFDETGTLQWTEDVILQAANFLHSLQQQKLISDQRSEERREGKDLLPLAP